MPIDKRYFVEEVEVVKIKAGIEVELFHIVPAKNIMGILYYLALQLVNSFLQKNRKKKIILQIEVRKERG